MSPLSIAASFSQQISTVQEQEILRVPTNLGFYRHSLKILFLIIDTNKTFLPLSRGKIPIKVLWTKDNCGHRYPGCVCNGHCWRWTSRRAKKTCSNVPTCLIRMRSSHSICYQPTWLMSISLNVCFFSLLHSLLHQLLCRKNNNVSICIHGKIWEWKSDKSTMTEISKSEPYVCLALSGD